MTEVNSCKEAREPQVDESEDDAFVPCVLQGHDLWLERDYVRAALAGVLRRRKDRDGAFRQLFIITGHSGRMFQPVDHRGRFAPSTASFIRWTLARPTSRRGRGRVGQWRRAVKRDYRALFRAEILRWDADGALWLGLEGQVWTVMPDGVDPNDMGGAA